MASRPDPRVTPHRVLDDTLELPSIPKPNLGLRRVHVDVDRVARGHDLEEHGRPNAGRNCGPVRELHGSDDSGIPNGPTIDRQVDPAAGCPNVARALDESADVRGPADVLNLEQAGGELRAEEGREAIPKCRGRRQHQRGLAVVRHHQSNFRARERKGRHHLRHASPLGTSAAQELPPRRRVVEQPRDVDRGPDTASDVVDRVHDAAGHTEPRPARVGRGRLDLDPRDRTDRRKRLSAKAERADTEEIFGASNLGRRVPSDRQHGILALHSAAVIAHPNALAAPVDDRDLDRRRSRVEGILDELLGHGRRPFDDLSRRDLVGDDAGKDRNSRGHRANYDARDETVNRRAAAGRRER